ncbi:cation:proton antiporter [Actinophytocola sp.]|uniref:cation:proton antiporter n=1 Tax=Actinophytocola sp. TaxID=1872138 RepID=UPI002D36B42C|nr:cation:proton antiporter [Actinophytocola sp.]HYQ62599.1 cation:proton antiporter [Actinophytocola sp.]
MSGTVLLAHAGHAVLVLGAVFALAFVARTVARLVRQPVVLVELAAGLAVGPVILAMGGPRLRAALLPATVLDWSKVVGQVGLVLFLIGVANEARMTLEPGQRRVVGWVSAGGLLVPLTIGAAFAAWVLTSAGPGLRGTAPAPALALLLAVSLAVTAVPVLARILAENNLAETPVGRLSVVVAVIIDAVSWLVVALAVGLATGGAGGMPRLAGLLVASLLAMVGVRRLLGGRVATRWCGARTRTAVVLVAAAGFATFTAMESWGLTGVFGAVLVGFAIPDDGQDGAWRRVVDVLSRGGRVLVPVFFVVTGATVFTDGLGPVPWVAIAAVTGLAVLGKVAGGYLGARLGGQSHRDGLRLGVLLNARGLTELVVLQAGHAAGILTPAMFLALLVMALTTTAMTRPAYALLERIAVGAGSSHQYRTVGT